MQVFTQSSETFGSFREKKLLCQAENGQTPSSFIKGSFLLAPSKMPKLHFLTTKTKRRKTGNSGGAGGYLKEQRFQEQLQATPPGLKPTNNKTRGMYEKKQYTHEADPETPKLFLFLFQSQESFTPLSAKLTGGQAQHPDYNQLPKPDLDLPKHQKKLESLMLPLPTFLSCSGKETVLIFNL